MELVKKQWIIFKLCHEGFFNKTLHFIGISFILLGILYLNIWLVLLGFIIQELGHAYQYWKSGLLKHNPITCIKPQSLFVYPVFTLIILYVIAVPLL